MKIAYTLNLAGINPSLEHDLVIPCIIHEVDLLLECFVYGERKSSSFFCEAEYAELTNIEVLEAVCNTCDYDGYPTNTSFNLSEKQFKFLDKYINKEMNKIEQLFWKEYDNIYTV